MVNRKQARKLVREALRNRKAKFRTGQWDAIDRLVNGRERLLAVERTGWGKSLVYFIATRLLRAKGYGPTLIVCPLLSLMRDQVEEARRIDITAVSFNSTTSPETWRAHMRAIEQDEVDAILIAPESFANRDFVESVLEPVVETSGLFVIDEAHCISVWGHDFRPDFRRIHEVVKRLGQNTPVLAATATATEAVITDIAVQIGDMAVQRGSLVRESIALDVVRLPSRSARMDWLISHIPQLPGAGIVYALTRHDVQTVADWLQKEGIAAYAYHGRVTHPDFANSNAYRTHLEDRLRANEVKVLVATTALGMGFNKPDLGFVIHFQAPGSLLNYYQQVGRAGRDGNRAYGILLTGSEDQHINAHFRSESFPRPDWIREILEALDLYGAMTIPRLQQHVNLSAARIEKVLRYLAVERPAVVARAGSGWERRPVSYHYDGHFIDMLTDLRLTEWREVLAYAETTDCLATTLARYLSGPESEACGICANCIGGPVIPAGAAPANSAAGFLAEMDLELRCNGRVPGKALLIDALAGNLPARVRAELGRILARWMEAGWGAMIRHDRETGTRFRDELVVAAAALIAGRWKPDPAPAWVTCIPSSHRRPGLVTDFAERLATELALPFHPVISRVRENEPQSRQYNAFHQCRNLDGAFTVQAEVPEGPVLLVDDVVRSRWSMTLGAVHLRRAGSGPVLPFALASVDTPV